MGELDVRIEDPRSLDAEWKGILARSVSPTVFQHPEWHRAWWDVFGAEGEPAFYAARDAGELVGLAPMRRDGSALTFSGDPEICDYMDIVIPRGREADVVAALLTAWEREGVDGLRLWGLRDGSRSLALFTEGGGVECEEEAVAPRIPIEGGWEAYLSRLSKKDRHELRRKMRRLESACGQLEFRAFTDPVAIDANLDEFFRLHTISRQDKAEFMTERMKAFFRRVALGLASEGLTRLFLLELDGVPAASLLGFEGEDLAVWNSGFDPAFSHLSVGLLSKVRALQWAQERGHRTVDFLRGREAYKYDLGGQDLRIYRCLVDVRAAASLLGAREPV